MNFLRVSVTLPFYFNGQFLEFSLELVSDQAFSGCQDRLEPSIINGSISGLLAGYA